jgi:hypothetical protein
MQEQQPKVHDFKERLRFSEQAGDEPFWEAAYRKMFPNMVNMMGGPGDTDSQRQGVDRVILLSNNHVLRIDEKKREKVYDDILLEYVSVDTTGAPGWIEKDLAIDFLAYAFMPTRQVYFFPWTLLRRAWNRYGEEWKRDYGKREAHNNGYKTLSCPVPISVLGNAVVRVCLVRLD